MERSGAPSGWSRYQYEQGNVYPSQLGSSHQSFLTSTGCWGGVGPLGAYDSAIPSPHPQSRCHFDTTPNNKNLHNSLAPRFPTSVQHRTEIFARDEVAAQIASRRFFSWYPSSQPGSSGWLCDVCSEEFLQSHALRVHFHQFHLNPHHLSPEDTRLFRLSNFLVNVNEDKEIKTEYPGLYRCHECFNVFNRSCSLRTHLQNHQEDPSTEIKTMVVAKMAPKIDKLSREDFEDVSPREKRPKAMKSNLKVQPKIAKKSKAKLDKEGLTTKIQQKRKSRKSKEAEIQSEPSDELTSDSDKERDIPNKYKQKNRKSSVAKRKSTLNSDIIASNTAKSLENSLSSNKESENGSHESDQIVNGHILESIDNVISHVKNEFVVPDDEVNLIKTMDENKSPNVKKKSNEIIPLKTKIKNKRRKQRQKKKLNNGTLKQLKQNADDLSGISSSSRRIRKNNKAKGKNDGITNSRKSKLKSPVKDKSSPQKSESSSRTKDLHADTSISNTLKKRPKSDKLWRLKIRDHSKASNLVQQLVQPASDFICLKCSQGFQSYSDLRHHKLHCKDTKKYPLCTDSKNLNNIKQETVEDYSQELFEYVTGSVTDIPETTFNNMHGKISDLNTEDAQKFSSNPLNEIGLVKLNYSGSWSVKDVWESGGWEPREDQLTWQQYELSSAINEQMQTSDVSSQSEQEVKSDVENGIKVDENLSDKEITPTNKPLAAPSVTDLAHSLTRKLTTQIVSRKAPLITCSSMDRRLVTKLARLPWSEQKKVKEKFDTSLVAKRTKRVSLSGENGQNNGHSSGIRQSGVTNRLDLKQLGRSVKYMKVGEREAQAKEKDQKKEAAVVEGELSGEWEIEHSFLCSVCGIEYDDVLEILHHKWESHPHCLVTHVSLKEGVVRPPALLYPQVGPSTIHLDPSATSLPAPPPLSCSKCSEEFSQTSEEIHGQFHSHLLTCGGVREQEGGKSRKRKRRGHGGGLKRTVRMMQKGNPTGNSRDGTDTEDASPRKKSQPPKKVIKPIPLIPTHGRTTRFKESKKKEARKLAARERRSRAKVERSTQNKEDKPTDTKIDEKSTDKVIVAEVLEKVISTVEKERGRPDRPRNAKKPKAPVKKIRERQREKRLSVVRARQMNLYIEHSSESEEVSEESEPETEATTESEQKSNTKMEKESGKEPNIDKSAIPKRKTRVVKTPPQPVLIKVENDENLQFMIDLDTVQPYVESPVRGRSPSKTPIRGRSPLKAIVSESTSSSSSVSPVRSSRDNISVVDSSVAGNSQEKNNELDKDIPSPKSASRSLKRLETNLVSKLILPTAMEDDPKRRSNFHVTYRSKFQPSRFVFPIELKISAIARVESGETQIAVARDLNINTATLAAWWLRRSEIKGKFEREVMLENGDDMKSTFAISNLLDKFKKEEKDVISKPEDIRPTSDEENQAHKKSLENRTGLPLNVKAKALKEIISGKTQAAVAKELGINPSTVAHWWAKKDLILHRHEASTEGVTDITSEESSSQSTNLGSQMSSVDKNDVLINGGDNEAIKHPGQKRRKSFDGRKFSDEIKLDALQRLDKGETKASIAKALGVGLTTLRMWSRKSNLGKVKIDDVAKEGTEQKIDNESEHKKEQKFSLEMKVKVIDRINSGEDITVVAKSSNVSEVTVEAWWKRRDKILRKNKQSKLSSSKVFTSQDENTVNISHDSDKNINEENDPKDKISNTGELEVDQKCMEKTESKVATEEKRGRRHHTSVSSQQSPIPNGRLYMPLEVKQSVIKRIEEGATQVEVARDLDMSLSTVASWWRKKETILQNLNSVEEKKSNPSIKPNKKEISEVSKLILPDGENVSANLKEVEDIKSSNAVVNNDVIDEKVSSNEDTIVTMREDIDSNVDKEDFKDYKDKGKHPTSNENHDTSESERGKENPDLTDSENLNASLKCQEDSELLSSLETAINETECESGNMEDEGDNKAMSKQITEDDPQKDMVNDKFALPTKENRALPKSEGFNLNMEDVKDTPDTYEYKNINSFDDQEHKSEEKVPNSLNPVKEISDHSEILEEKDSNEPVMENELLKLQNDISANESNKPIVNGEENRLQVTETESEIKAAHEKIPNEMEKVTVADILDQSMAVESKKNGVIDRSTPSPDNSKSENDVKPAKVVKKKSLDFLANTLMKKALARSQTQLTPLLPEASQSSVSMTSHCHLVQESSVLSEVPKPPPTSPPPSTSPSSPPFSPAPAQPQSSGLGLIVASYCSSDEEL